MKKIIIASLLACSFLSLTGCEKGVGVGADSSSSKGTTQSESLISKKTIASADELAKAIKMPAPAMIYKGFQDFNDMGALAVTLGQPSATILVTDGIRDAKKSAQEITKNVNAQLAASAPDGKKPEFKNADEIEDTMRRSYYAGAISTLGQPIAGWPFDLFNPRDKEAAVLWIRNIMTIATFSDLVMTEIASKIDGHLLRDPAQASEAIKEVWDAIPTATLNNAWAQAQESAKNSGITLDMVTGRGVGWQCGEASYYWDETGFRMRKNGGTWFGDGKISGKAYEIAMTSSISAVAEKSKELNNSQSTARKEGVSGSVNVK